MTSIGPQLGTERSKSIISESSVSVAQVCQKIYQSERRSQRKTNESARLGKSQSACIGLAVVSEPDLTKALVCDVTAAMARRHRSKAAKITQMWRRVTYSSRTIQIKRRQL